MERGTSERTFDRRENSCGGGRVSTRYFEGRAPQVAPGVWVDPTAVLIGDVTIGADASIWPFAVVRGDVHRIEIGARSNIQDGAILHVSHDSRFRPRGAPTIVHDDVTVGHQVVLHGCEVHDLCLIGIGARVLDGAVVGPRTLIGAGALVAPGTVLEGGYLYLGAPARRVRPLTDQEHEHLAYSAAHYVRVAARHRDASGPSTAQDPNGRPR
nr:gamma carbonic anhydrase family protein [Thiococcus pfennigii]